MREKAADKHLRRRTPAPVLIDLKVNQGQCRSMTMLSPQKAADRAHVGRTTIMRALEKGEIVAVRNNSGRWQIAPEAVDDWLSMRPVRTHDGQSPQKSSVSVELAVAEARIEMLNEQLNETRSERDQARADAAAQREMLKAALDDMRNRPSIWSRLFRS